MDSFFENLHNPLPDQRDEQQIKSEFDEQKIADILAQQNVSGDAAEQENNGLIKNLNGDLLQDSDVSVAILEEFRRRLPLEVNNAVSNSDCVRFLKARSQKIPAAIDMINKWWIWWNAPLIVLGGQTIKPSNILSLRDYEKQSIVNECFPFSNSVSDRDGRPVYWEKTGVISVKMPIVKQHFSLDEMIFLHVRQQEVMMRRIREANKPELTQLIVVFDLTQLVYTPDVFAFKSFHKFVQIEQKYYPERLYRMYIINAPRFFTYMWNIMKGWMDVKTVSKIKIIGKDYLPELVDLLGLENVPVEYGGVLEGVRWVGPWDAAEMV